MLIATCQIELSLGGVSSLKEKRRIIKSVVARLSNQFNIAVAEIDHHEVWQSAALGIAAVGNDHGYLQSALETVVAWIEGNRPDVLIVAYRIDFR